MTVNGPEKILYLTLGIMFLALGVVGLLIPIIPGVLFLAGAVYMLGRGSERIRTFTESHPHLSGLQARLHRLNAVSVFDRIRVAALMTLETTVAGVEKLALGVRRLIA